MPDQVFECTSCSKVIKTTYDLNLHPLLDCLLCRRCYQNYGNGDFSVFEDGIDSEGDDNYCRWCCDGGQLYGCMNIIDGKRCHYSFCEDCIKKNVPNDIVFRIGELPEEQQKTVRWHCYVCDKSKIADLRKEAMVAMEMLNRNEKRSKTDPLPSPAKKKRTSEQQPEPANTAPAKTPTTTSAKISTSANPESTTNTSTKEPTTTPAKTPTTPSAKTPTTPSVKTPTTASIKTPTTTTPESTTTATTKVPTATSTKTPSTTSTTTIPESTTSNSAKTVTTTPLKPPTLVTTKVTTTNVAAKVPTVPVAKTILIPTTKPATAATSKVPIDITTKPMPLSKKKALLTNTVRLTDLPMNEESIKTKDTQNGKEVRTYSSADSAGKKQNGQPPKPKDAAPAPPVPPKKDPKSNTIEVIETNRKDNSKSMQSHSRKENGDVVKKLPSKEVALNKSEVKTRLDVYRRTKDACMEEIGGNFDTINEMILSSMDAGEKSWKRMIEMKIESLRKPIQEFEYMINDLKRLSQSLGK